MDVSDDWFLEFLQKTLMAQQIPLALLLFWLGSLPCLVWGVIVRVAACTTMHWYVSCRAHSGSSDDWKVEDAVIQANNVP